MGRINEYFSIHFGLTYITWIAGAIIFIVLTMVTISARPGPLRLAGEHLASLESRLGASASDLWKVGRDVGGWGKSLESSFRGAGGQVCIRRCCCFGACIFTGLGGGGWGAGGLSIIEDRRGFEKGD